MLREIGRGAVRSLDGIASLLFRVPWRRHVSFKFQESCVSKLAFATRSLQRVSATNGEGGATGVAFKAEGRRLFFTPHADADAEEQARSLCVRADLSPEACADFSRRVVASGARYS